MAPDRDDPFDLDEALRRALSPGAGDVPAPQDLVGATVAACLSTVPGAEAVALSYVLAGRVRSTHASDPAIAELDRAHTDGRRGPLLDAALTQPLRRSVIIVADLTDDDLWCPTALPSGPRFRSLHSTTLRSARGGRAALDLYATLPHAFGLDTMVFADMFAASISHQLYGPIETAPTRYDLAIDTISRRLEIDPAKAEQLLLCHLHPDGDPAAVAERLTHHIEGTDTAAPD